MNWNKALVLICVLQAGALFGRFGAPGARAADPAPIPSAFNQTDKIVDELQTLNQKMDRLSDLLNSGKLQVKVATPDEGSKQPASDHKRGR